MKQTLLIIALFIGLGNVNAQDASNDATWEETISFLNKYSGYFKNTGDHESYQSWEEEISFSNNFYINTVKWEKQKNRDGKVIWMNKVFYEMKINLSKITKVTDGCTNCISIYTVGANISTVRKGKRYLYDDREWINANDLTDNPSVKNNTYLIIEDKEMLPRIKKAFQHLAYLATQKRKAARKASGDKF